MTAPVAAALLDHLTDAQQLLRTDPELVAAPLSSIAALADATLASQRTSQPIRYPALLSELTAAAEQLRDTAAELLRGGNRHAAAHAFATATTALAEFEQLRVEWDAAHAATLLT